MNPTRKRKLTAIIAILFIVSAAMGLILYALKQNINLFYTPSQLQQAHLELNQHIRVGGYVKKHSLQYDASGQTVNFTITDNTANLVIQYHGVLPNLFREGQGVVVTGQMTDGKFIASEVLAKHDEKYTPPVLKNIDKRET